MILVGSSRSYFTYRRRHYFTSYFKQSLPYYSTSTYKEQIRTAGLFQLPYIKSGQTEIGIIKFIFCKSSRSMHDRNPSHGKHRALQTPKSCIACHSGGYCHNCQTMSGLVFEQVGIHLLQLAMLRAIRTIQEKSQC